MSYGAFPIFPLHGNPYKTVLKHNKFLNSRESYAILHFTQRLCQWGSRLMPSSGGISPLTCTHFDPNIFFIFSKSNFFHISPTSPKKSIMGNSSTSLLKSHTGATQALTGARESWFVCLKNEFVHIYGFFSVFGLWHKANSVFTSPKFPPIFQNKNFDLQLFFFRVNITHHEGDFFCFVSCVLQEVSISMKVSGVPLRNILCLTRSG